MREAKPGKGDDLDFREADARSRARARHLVCLQGRHDLGTDTFESEAARQAHLNGEIPKALGQVGPDLLASDPDIRTVEILAVK